MSLTPWLDESRPERVMLDANIVRGQLTTNILLWMGEHGVLEPHWSQEVLNEAKRNRPEDREAMVGSHRREPRSLSSLIDVMASKRMRILRGFALKLNDAVLPEQRGTSDVLTMATNVRRALGDTAPARDVPVQPPVEQARQLNGTSRDRTEHRAVDT